MNVVRILGRKYAFAVLCLSLVACSGTPQRADKAAETQPTVFALTPALTEIAAGICQRQQLPVVCTHSDYPAWVTPLPKIPTLPLDLESLLAAKPGLVLAEAGMHSPATLATIAKLGLRVKELRLQNLEDLYTACDSIGHWTGNTARATTLADSVQRLVAQYKNRLAAADRRAVALLYFSPIMAYGATSWMGSKMQYLGLANAIGPYPSPAKTLTAEELAALPADVWLIPGAPGRALPPALGTVLALKPHTHIGYLDENLAARPSIRLGQQLEDICTAVEGSRPR